MRLLKNISDDEIFYYGTIVVIKDSHITPTGTYDGKYAMVGNSGVNGFRMMDLSRSIGSCTWHDLEINDSNAVPGHFGVKKQALYAWVKEYFELFYTQEGKDDFIPRLEEIVYVDDLDNHFVQSNRNLFMDTPEEDSTKRAADADKNFSSYDPELAEKITKEGQDNVRELQKALGETPDPDNEYEDYSRELIEKGWKKVSEGYNSLMALHKHFETTPQEELERQWKEIEEQTKDIEGPTVDEYFNSLNPNYMYQKGYTEGATKFREVVELKLQTEFGEGEEATRNRILNILKEVFDNN